MNKLTSAEEHFEINLDLTIKYSKKELKHDILIAIKEAQQNAIEVCLKLAQERIIKLGYEGLDINEIKNIDELKID